MVLILPQWVDYVIFAAIGFWIDTEYMKYKANPKTFWKGWFD